MTRNRDLNCEDIFGCDHSPEIPIVDNGTVVGYVCRCGDFSTNAKPEPLPSGHFALNHPSTTPLDAHSTPTVVLDRKPPRVSAAVCMTFDGYAFMVRHRERGWEFPVGKVEPDELLQDAAARELREEAGFWIEPYTLQLVAMFQLRGESFGHWLNFMFAVTVRRLAEPKIGGDSNIVEGRWFKWDLLNNEGLLPLTLNGHPLSKTSIKILTNASLPREERDPGMQTHCYRCLAQIPCRCMRGASTREGAVVVEHHHECGAACARCKHVCTGGDHDGYRGHTIEHSAGCLDRSAV